VRLFHSSKKYSYQTGVKTQPAYISLTKTILLTVIGGVVFVIFLVFHNSEYTEVRPASTKKINLKKPLNIKAQAFKLLSGGSNFIIQTSTNFSTVPDILFEHNQVITTIFWIGEEAGSDNGFISNTKSAWDEQWQQRYGGIDDPSNRNGYLPALFTPNENPFYIALPYNDIAPSGQRKSTAFLCPNAQRLTNQPYSWCKNSWVKVSRGDLVAYAQWEDVGPYHEDDLNYVFYRATPINKKGASAGLDVSPALADYLKLQDVDTASWCFVLESDVPAGPWKNIITRSLGNKL
jgi:hypothetical protein